MPTKIATVLRKPSKPVSLALFRRVVADVAQLSRQIEDLQKESAGHLRRCAELQHDLDELKKLMSASV